VTKLNNFVGEATKGGRKCAVKPPRVSISL
jgi:hypothetical protein